MLLARWLVPLVATLVSPPILAGIAEVGIDWRVLGFTLGLSVLTGLLFGVAPGAQPGDLLRMTLGQGMLMAGIGLGLGLAGSLALTRVVESLLYSVKPTDPPTYITVSALLLTVALLATYLPARRAARVDPLVALRWE